MSPVLSDPGLSVAQQPSGRRPSPLTSLGTVLGVWAHPDDEVYMAGGLMQLLVEAGLRVVCVTATSGEHGTNPCADLPPARLAAVRRGELAESLAILGVAEHRQLGYVDGALADVDPAVGAARVRAVVEAVRPDTVLTFGPDGYTGHPDHSAVSRWTAGALAGRRRPVRVLHATRTADWWDDGPGTWVDIAMGPGVPPAARTSRAQLALDLALDGAVLDRKVAALHAHASQVRWVVEALGHDRFRRWVACEQFVQA